VKARQGASFDPRAFHAVLRQGPLPLIVLERLVNGQMMST